MVTLWLDIKDFLGQTLETFKIDDLKLTYRLSDVGGFTGFIAFSDPGLTQDLFAPRRTDYRIKLSTDNGQTFTPLQGGFCGPVGLRTNDPVVRIAGLDWIAWLDQPYHFEGYSKNPSTWTDSDVLKYWTGASQQQIISNILAGMYDGTAETLQLTASYNGTGWLQNVDLFYILLGDTSTALSMVQSVGEMVDPYGFDFTCEYNKHIVFYAPRRVTVDNAIPMAVFAPSYENGLIDIDWQNKGPIATASVGMPTAALMKYYSYPPSRAAFRKWLEIIPLNDTIRTSFQAQQATNDIGGLHSNPQKENSITILPHLMDPFDETVGFFNHCGKVVFVDSEDDFMPYHRVNAPYYITEQEIYNVDGNWRCRMVLDQIYAVD